MNPDPKISRGTLNKSLEVGARGLIQRCLSPLFKNNFSEWRIDLNLNHILSLAVAGATLASMPSVASAATLFGFSSSPESFIGQGEIQNISPGDGYQMGAFLGWNNYIHFYAVGHTSVYNPWRNNLPPDFTPRPSDPATFWEVAVGMGNGQLPHVGTFIDPATEPSYLDPWVSFTGNYRASNQTSGSFTIREITFNAGGELTSLALDFTHFGENNLNWRDDGYVRFNSDVPLSAVPEPSMYAMFAVGLVATALTRRRKKAPSAASQETPDN